MRFHKSTLSLSRISDYGCIFLFSGTIISVLVRHYWIYAHDQHKCEATLTRGQWLDSPATTPTARPFQNWQPEGCMLRDYDNLDLVKCLKKDQHIAYIGDSTIRQLFWATARKLDAERAFQEQHMTQKHTNLVFQHGDRSIVFVWDPYLNSSSHQQRAPASILSYSGLPDSTAAIVLFGGGLWHARYLGEDWLLHFTKAVDNITAYMKKDHALIPQIQATLTIFAPVQIPRYDLLDREKSQKITPARVKAMNEHLLQLSLRHGTPVAWAFPSMTFHQPAAYDPSGMHAIEDVAERMVDIILNMKCNAQLMQDHGYPLENTCCMDYPSPTWTQRIIVIFSALMLPLMLLITHIEIRSTLVPSRKVSRALTALAVAVCYCYFADRSQLWNKALKRYDPQTFAILGLATIMLGFVSVRRSEAPTIRGNPPSPAIDADQPFLSRDQSDEFKGWMQFCILIYHYLGASKVLSIYEVIRLLVASYLFMTGFGHALFFYKKGDYSLPRSAAVLIRLNLLSVILPFVMRTDYLFYYFAPLTSFWYIIVYLTMYIAHQRNYSLIFLTSKIIFSAVLVNTLIRAPRVFEDLFQLLERVCNIHWNASEWRFRLQLDSYIVYVGMLCGILSSRSAKALRLTIKEDISPFEDISLFGTFIRNHFRKLRLAGLALALTTPPVFYLFAKNAADKYAYNAWVPYVSTPVIFSYIVLRNYSRHARNYYSSIFAWMGRHSLETFTLQFHIWLAGDTKGLLKTGMLDRWIGQLGEFTVLTIIFLWICWHVSAATQTLTGWIIEPNARGNNADVSRDWERDVLPRTKSEEELSYALGVSNWVAVGMGRGASRFKGWIAQNLRVRLVIIVMVLWVLNMSRKDDQNQTLQQWQE
ncbi:MAG: hypothetical protein Q9163_001281 [Psora crenata]